MGVRGIKIHLGLVLWLFALIELCISAPYQPHIVVIIVDDLGWNDVGYHNRLMPTPNINQLAAQSIRFNSHYVHPVCTPTRAALLTGRYPFRYGLQYKVIQWPQPKYLPSDEVLLPQHLKHLGYSTHLVGKWHLGSCRWEYLPTRRGFDTFFGNLGDQVDHFTHLRVWGPEPFNATGKDLREGEESLRNTFNGTYSTNLFTEAAVAVIRQHAAQNVTLQGKVPPMFLYVAFTAPHAPVQAPAEYIQRCTQVPTTAHLRRTFCGMVASIDEAVKNITDALKQNGMWDDVILLFMSDNGGDPEFGGNNWPLRGRKRGLTEGGVRSTAFAYLGKNLWPDGSGGIPPGGIVNKQTVHVVDWFPTLLRLANGGVPIAINNATHPSCGGNGTGPVVFGRGKPIDGVDIFASLIDNTTATPRTEVVLNIDSITPLAGVRVGPWKLISMGSARNETKAEHPSPAYIPVRDVYTFDPALSKLLNESLSTPCNHSTVVAPKRFWLFNIAMDPLECYDVSDAFPNIVVKLAARLAWYNESQVRAQNPPLDPRSNPKYWHGIWSPWVSLLEQQQQKDDAMPDVWWIVSIVGAGVAVGAVVGAVIALFIKRRWRRTAEGHVLLRESEEQTNEEERAAPEALTVLRRGTSRYTALST